LQLDLNQQLKRAFEALYALRQGLDLLVTVFDFVFNGGEFAAQTLLICL
jgi:hypothetical protein